MIILVERIYWKKNIYVHKFDSLDVCLIEKRIYLQYIKIYLQYIKTEIQQNFIIVLLKIHDLLSFMCIMVIL